jgi:hypothetical protein
MENQTQFKQTRKIGVAGGFFNQLMGNNGTYPIVGKGATMLHYTDRDAYEVVWVSDDFKECKIAPCVVEYEKDGSGYATPTGKIYGDNLTTVRWRNGSWKMVHEYITYTNSFIEIMDAKCGKGNWYGWDALDVIDGLFNEEGRLNLIDDVTRKAKKYSKISIIFGSYNHYRDPHF